MGLCLHITIDVYNGVYVNQYYNGKSVYDYHMVEE